MRHVSQWKFPLFILTCASLNACFVPALEDLGPAHCDEAGLHPCTIGVCRDGLCVAADSAGGGAATGGGSATGGGATGGGATGGGATGGGATGGGSTGGGSTGGGSATGGGSTGGGASDAGTGGPDGGSCVPDLQGLLVPTNATSMSTGGTAPTATTTIVDASHLLDLDFGGPNTMKQGVAAAGSSTSDLWNAVGPGGNADYASTLVWANGTPSPVKVRVQNLPGNWALTSAIGDLMYNSYSYSWTGSTATLTLVGLPAGTYDVYVYASVSNGNTGSSATTCRLGSSTAAQFTSSTSFASRTAWTAGEMYSLHSGLVVLTDDSLTIQLLGGVQGPGNAYVLINGLQVVSH
jgi:hypothetical protein